MFRWWQRRRERRQRAEFARRQPELLALYLAAAGQTGKPRGLTWIDARPEGEPLFARDRRSGQLVAFLPVTLQFQAVAGSDMDGWAAADRPRDATAVFAWVGGRWTTAGVTVFNLGPAEAIERFRHQYERVADA